MGSGNARGGSLGLSGFPATADSLGVAEDHSGARFVGDGGLFREGAGQVWRCVADRGGVPHAIGPGIFMVEIQEPTDYVVRCEYAHGGLTLDESARTMGLGLERVLDLFDYAEYPLSEVKERFGPRIEIVAEADGGREESVLAAPQTDRLELRRVECREDLRLDSDGRFSILIVTEGSGRILAGGRELALRPWSRCFLPARLTDVVVEGVLRAVRCLPPQPRGVSPSRPLS